MAILKPTDPAPLRQALEAVEDDAVRERRRGGGLLNLEPYREIRIEVEEGQDPLEKVDFRAIRGSVTLDIKTGGTAELSFSLVDNARYMLRQSEELGVPEFYGRRVQFWGGYAQPQTARRQLFTGRLIQMTPQWQENGEILLHFKAIGDLFGMSRIFRQGRNVYPRISNTKQKEQMADRLEELGVPGARDTILEEWAVAEEITLGDIFKNKIEQYRLRATVDDIFFTDPFTLRAIPDEEGREPKQKVQTNESDYQFIIRLARENDALVQEIGAGEIAVVHEDSAQQNRQEDIGFVYHTPYRPAGTKSYITPEEFDPRERSLFPILSVSPDIDLLKFAAQGQVGVQTNPDGTISISLKRAETRPGLFDSNLRVVDQEALDLMTNRELSDLLISAVRAPFDQRSRSAIQPVLVNKVGRRTGSTEQEEGIPLRVNPGWKMTIQTVGSVHFQVGESYRVYNLAQFLEGWWLCRSVRLQFAPTKFSSTVVLGWAGEDVRGLGLRPFTQ